MNIDISELKTVEDKDTPQKYKNNKRKYNFLNYELNPGSLSNRTTKDKIQENGEKKTEYSYVGNLSDFEGCRPSPKEHMKVQPSVFPCVSEPGLL